MKHKLLPLLMLFMLSLTACTKSLVNDIYRHAGEDNKDSLTAFVILSNMYLSEDEIEKIEKDYKNEKNRNRQYYYQYLLAKRTQENIYIAAFIKNSKDHLNEIAENNSNWISVGSPLYKQLAYYSKTNDDALNLLFELIKISDGAGLSIVSEDLFAIRKVNQKRFSKAARRAGVQEAEINNLMEDE